MDALTRIGWIGFIALTLAVSGCGGGSGGDTPPAGTVVGAAGGTVAGPSGAKVVIPAGALATDTTINITQIAASATALPAGFSVSGQTFAFTPHGTTFAVPVTMTLPFNPALVPVGTTPRFYKTNSQSQWEQITNATFGTDTATAQVTSFSDGAIVIPPLEPVSMLREWEFKVIPGSGVGEVHLDGDTLLEGQLEEFATFGSSPFDLDFIGVSQSFPSDNMANGMIFSSSNGVTFGVFAEAPYAKLGGPDPIGSVARLKQTQSFIKRAADASFKFTLTSVVIEAIDFNPPLLKGVAPLKGEVIFSVGAFTTSQNYFFYTAGQASVFGSNDNFFRSTKDLSFSRNHLWSDADFDFVSVRIPPGEENNPCNFTDSAGSSLALKNPRTYRVDLSSVDVGEEFTIRIDTIATTYNRRGGGPAADCEGSAVNAFLRDPQEIGGTTIEISGLEPTNRPLTAPPDQVLIEPAACVPGPGPNADAGVLQFESGSYTLDETAGAVPTITVTRSGGSVGAVTATFATSDGTAIGGMDYTPVNATVFFADGDIGQRVVSVPTIPNLVIAADKTVNLALSQPGGCAALGAQTSAVLTIRDDGGVVAPRPPLPRFTIGGTVNGLVGAGLVLQDLTFLPITPRNGPFTFASATASGSPYAVTITTQPTNPLQVCSVANGNGTVANANITNVLVNCVTPAANGALDPSFGDAGKVSTAFGGDETAMALQADGKIVMVGGLAGDFVLARYNVNGGLDAGFGSAGTVTTDIATGSDEAHGVAIQPDGKIVVVGQAVVGRTANNLFNFDFALARYNADGSLDTGFGVGGKITTDFNVLTDQAFAVAIQGDGKIVVVGSATRPVTTGSDVDFAVARYNANGTLDMGFGSGGKLTTDIAGGIDIAHNVVVLQPSGAILVSGAGTRAGDASLDHAGLARYDTNGVLDGSFGSGGKLTLVGKRVDEGLVLQGDGKILLAGSVSIGIFPARSSQFAVMRLLANGGPDNSFGTAGLVTTPFSTLDDFGRVVALQADGRILVAGQRSNQLNPDFAVARYATNGTLDGSFGTGGKLTIDFFGSSDSAENVIVQPDGRILLGGFARNGTRTGYGLARVLP